MFVELTLRGVLLMNFFAVFVNASEAIALDPANRRLFVRTRDAGGSIRGATSVAAERQSD